MAGVAKQPGQRQSNSHILALLSLKILLLAFFILLNALSSFEEERRTAVVDSVRQAFQGVLPAQFNLSSAPAAIDVFEGAENVVEALHKLFGRNLPIVESAESPGTWTMRVDLPVTELFAGEGEALLPEGAETLRLIAGVLADERFATPGYRVDLLYGLAAPGQESEGQETALARAGALVRELERQGLPAPRLSSGLMPAFAGRVRILFTIELEAPAPADNSQADATAGPNSVRGAGN